jgi:hypothetical protein
MPYLPPWFLAVFKVFLNDFVYWSMVRFSPSGLLVALGVPLEVQKQLSSREVAQLYAFLESIEPMGARRNGQLLEQHMSEFDSQQIGDIQASTLVLHARDDTLVSFEQGEFSARKIPGAQFIPMEKGGHLALMFDINAGRDKRILERLNDNNPISFDQKRGASMATEMAFNIFVFIVFTLLWLFRSRAALQTGDTKYMAVDPQPPCEAVIAMAAFSTRDVDRGSGKLPGPCGYAWC